ncbi:hydrogenase expression/formation protein HypE [Nannocystis exedens]|uniref:Hydrogenase expression/formation protein HypE n=1 Tax=Nannocystis exedens TaxID=54 RepID=A0A1I2FHF3_9BACT|nr:hydrogenase expression/formation protein HypE [Nannocystis exedens]PCC70438.1 hydrogenase expression/formation protein HypE [Nannocystis exedens]SFF04309.1 hydrogenase expression/formation protein HypE [Nannocystis exedens]
MTLEFDCPAPSGRHEHIILGHGSGGKLGADLVARMFLSVFGNAAEDAAACAGAGRLAFTTDAFVVRPIFFPGGDIGRLAIAGTVNDLAVSGALPRYVSAAFILEEGLAMADLERIVASMRATCEEAGVVLVAGDTKVVDRGKGDRVFITTSGIGFLPQGRALSISAAQPGDRVLVSGTLGDHGIAILSQREGLEFDTALTSDVQPLADLAQAILQTCSSVRCMRDPTRGGLAGVLHDLATASRVGVRLHEQAVPLAPAVRAACELLGLDPLHVASEGRLVAVAPADEAEGLLAAMRRHPRGRESAIVGEVVADHAGTVVLRSRIGGERVVRPLAGEQLPRIC